MFSFNFVHICIRIGEFCKVLVNNACFMLQLCFIWNFLLILTLWIFAVFIPPFVHACICVCVCIYIYINTGCPRRNVQDFGRVFLMLKYTDITQNTYIQSWTVTEIMAREVWNFDSCYTLIDYQIHIKTGRNMWFL